MNPARLLRSCGLLLALLAGFVGSNAQAHLTPNSEVSLAIGAQVVVADIIVPQGEYGYATGNPAANDSDSLAIARDYVARRVAVAAPDGRPWEVEFRSIEFVQIAGPPDLHAIAVLTPPPGAPLRKFTIDWRVLLDSLPGHFAFFFLTSDHAGKIGQDREIIGAARAGSSIVKLELGQSSMVAGFVNATFLGIKHIARGYDHLLFLLALLLSAPLIARSGRWCEMRPPRQAVGAVLKVISAFTAGHSLTLVAATLWDAKLPAAPVEVLIAVSVMIAALHAIRPLFPRFEPLVAMVFGLVHGLAFATVLAEADTGLASSVVSLLGFNIGIELVQVGLVALIAPSLWILLGDRRFVAVRPVAASIAGAAALAWTVNRTTGGGAALVTGFETVFDQAGWLVGLLILASLASLVRGSGSRHLTGLPAAHPDNPA